MAFLHHFSCRAAANRGSLAVLCLLLLMTLQSERAAGEALTVAGDDEHLWVVQPVAGRSQPGVAIWHRGADDAVEGIARLDGLRGRVLPQGVAAAGASLWLIYDGPQRQPVQRLDVSEREPVGGWWLQREQAASLPAGVRVRRVGASDEHDALWALVQVTSPRVLDAFRPTPPAEAPPSENETLGSDATANDTRAPAGDRPVPAIGETRDPLAPPPPMPNEEADRVTDTVAEERAAAPRPLNGVGDAAADEDHAAADLAVSDDALTPTDQLLRLLRGRWQVIPLPADWPSGAPAWLIDGGDGRIRLIARVNQPAAAAGGDAGGAALWLYRWTGEDWSARRVDRFPGVEQVEAVIAVEGQLVAVRPLHPAPTSDAPAQSVSVQLIALRAASATSIGRLSIDQPGLDAWQVVSIGRSVALMAWDARAASELRPALDSEPAPAPGPGDSDTDAAPIDTAVAPLGDAAQPTLWWARMNLQGQLVQEPAPLVAHDQSGGLWTANYTILVAVLVLSVLLMLLFWRRDAQAHRLVLPPGVVLAPLSHRALAGAIDLAPAVLLVMAWYGISGAELLMRWPGLMGQMQHWQGIEPGALAVALFVGYVTLSELLTTRTLGKWITGLRVVNLLGERPRLWQLLTRNLLKSFDLVAHLLLLLPLLGPFRQRLGDLVARTVVVCPAPEAPTPDKPDEEDEAEEQR